MNDQPSTSSNQQQQRERERERERDSTPSGTASSPDATAQSDFIDEPELVARKESAVESRDARAFRPREFAAGTVVGTIIFSALYCLVVYLQNGRLSAFTVPVGFALGLPGAIVMSSLLFVSNDFWLKSVVPYFGVIAGVTFAGTFFYWQWFSAVRDQKAGVDFYTTAGQILPVFLLAALIDARQTRDTSRTQTATYFGVIAIGELMALFALAFDVRSSITFAPVAASVSAALLGLTCALLARER